MEENERVIQQAQALQEADFKTFLKLVQASGDSSFKWLQNIYSNQDLKNQSLSLALALTGNYIYQSGLGACRVHGGGFAGTIQVFLSQKSVQEYIQLMDKIFGKGSAISLKIRQHGIAHFRYSELSFFKTEGLDELVGTEN
ncbi:MAG TPA: hypothetical protein EYP36_11400 [Calditrichaeota bacterium]|nr:hypothetical protein [Calditrichota bacterium]